MLKEAFIGRKISHFQMNSAVKAFIISETFFWSAWNFIIPIIAIFAINNISGGKIEIASSAFSLFLISRIIFELISGKFLARSSEIQKIITTIAGISIISFSYIGFVFTSTITFFFLFYALAGVGFGISSPAKFSLFSQHLDKNKEVMEWGIYDAVALFGMALAASLGGFIVKIYGFDFIFSISAIINFLAIIPYLLLIRKTNKK